MRTLLVSATLATLVSGCSTAVAGHAKPLPDLDVSRFTDKPCSLITPSQLNQLGDFETPVPQQEPGKSMCKLNPRRVFKPGYSLSVRQDSLFESGRENTKGAPVYRETEVAGYPAFSYSGSDIGGVCSTVVRSSSRSSIQVTVVGEPEVSPELADACSATEKTAAVVVTNLK
ncbi:DUF3558 family protein [Lentzea aerocolonigenes]|uniref:DUF3558 family protein n=1 Tax=Lentzea aerocolonigenes TaxID=68170 RepID=UPI0005EBF832|nr:DUF3558 family protein [Lentzea aerocolonigenes]